MSRVAVGSVRRFAMAAGFLIVLLVIWGSGCAKETPTPDTNVPAGGSTSTAAPVEKPAKDIPTEAPKPPVDKVMATVNNVDITESQVKERVQFKWGAQLQKLAAQSPQFAAQQEKTLMRSAMNELVIEQLLEEQAKLASIEVSEAQLIEEMTKQLAAAKPPRTIEQFKKDIESEGGSYEAMKMFLAKNMRYTKLLESKSPDATKVTEEDAKKYYDENPDEFKIAEQVRASHILITTEAKDPNADPNQTKAQAREKAEKLLKQVKEGADFATVAKENSSCPSAAQGGDLGMFGRGSMVPPFEEAAFGLKVGEISDLVETQFGYHIIKVTAHQDPNTVAFATARDDIMDNLKTAKMQEAFRSYITSLQEKAKITYAEGAAPPVRPVAPRTQTTETQTSPQSPKPSDRPVEIAPPADANKG